MGKLKNEKAGRTWNKHNGKVKIKRSQGKLFWIWENEDHESTIKVDASDYYLKEEDLNVLIWLGYKGTKIAIRNIAYRKLNDRALNNNNKEIRNNNECNSM